MGEHTKKIRYRRGGSLYDVKLYTTAAEVAPDYVSLRDGTTTVYAKLGAVGHATESHLRARKGGTTYSVLASAAPLFWDWAVKIAGTLSVQYAKCTVSDDGSTFVSCRSPGGTTGYYDIAGTPLNTSINGHLFGKYDKFQYPEWITYLSPTYNSKINGVAVDPGLTPASYFAGTFSDASSSVGGILPLASTGNEALVVSKISANGVPVWATTSTGGGRCTAGTFESNTDGSSLCIRNGYLYVAGTASGVVSLGGYTISTASSSSFFVAKISTVDGSVQWVTTSSIGTAFYASAVCSTPTGICVVGHVSHSGAYQFTFGGVTSPSIYGQQGFISTLDDSGTVTALQILNHNGVNGSMSRLYGVSSDPSGNLYVVGWGQATFTGDILDLGNSVQINGYGWPDITFIAAKYNSSLIAQWVTANSSAGGKVYGGAVAHSTPTGNVFFTGYYVGSAPSIGGLSLPYSSYESGFVLQVDPMGSPVVVKDNKGYSNSARNTCISSNLNGAIRLAGYGYIRYYYDSEYLTMGAYYGCALLGVNDTAYPPSYNPPPSGPPFEFGSGTLADPYQIWYLEDLNNIRNYTTNHYILMRDLDFNDDSSYAFPATNKPTWTTGNGWPRLGVHPSSYITGSFDGNMHAISNLYAANPSTSWNSLFGTISSGCVIKNLMIDGGTVSGVSGLGAIVGYMRDSGTELYNCVARNVNISASSAGAYAGGLTGAMRVYAKIRNCMAINCTVTGNSYVGGVCGGSCSDTTYPIATLVMEHVAAVGGTVTSTGTWSHANLGVGSLNGGLVDQITSGTIRKCYSDMNISTVNGSLTGGLVGAGWTTNANTSVTDAYYNSDKYATSIFGTGKTTAELKQQATFSNWDFNSVWIMSESASTPILRSWAPRLLG